MSADLAARLEASLALLQRPPSPGYLAALEETAREAFVLVAGVYDSGAERGDYDQRLARVEQLVRELCDALRTMRLGAERRRLRVVS